MLDPRVPCRCSGSYQNDDTLTARLGDSRRPRMRRWFSEVLFKQPAFMPAQARSTIVGVGKEGDRGSGGDIAGGHRNEGDRQRERPPAGCGDADGISRR